MIPYFWHQFLPFEHGFDEGGSLPGRVQIEEIRFALNKIFYNR